jgi:hypothetical protein
VINTCYQNEEGVATGAESEQLSRKDTFQHRTIFNYLGKKLVKMENDPWIKARQAGFSFILL